jgi:hypothetical protein
MGNVFHNQLFSNNHSLRGNVFANSFPRNGPHVTICFKVRTLEKIDTFNYRGDNESSRQEKELYIKRENFFQNIGSNKLDP